MDNVVSASGSNSGVSRLKKHVTTACDPCRRRRRKCDGQIPCSTCHSAGESCSFSGSDGRRQRHEHRIVDHALDQRVGAQTHTRIVLDDLKPQLFDSIKNGASNGNVPHTNRHRGDNHATGQSRVAGPSPKSAKQYVQKDEPVSSDSISVNPHLRDVELSEIHLPQRTAADHIRRHAQPIAPNKSSGRAGRRSPAEVFALKDLQGNFEARAANLGRHSDIDDLGIRPSAHHRLLPKNPPTARTLRIWKPSHDGNLHGDQRQSQQFRWQLKRRPYAVPGYTRTFGNMPFSSSIVANGYSTDIQARQTLKFSTPEHLLLSLIDIDDTPLGRAFVDFQQMGQRLIAEGAPPSQVADQGLIDVTLFFRDRLPRDPVNASTWTSEMLRAFKGTLSDEILLACAFGVGSLMRWILMPTPENYRRIPSMMRPTDMQRLKPHPAWVDLMVFPTFRNALITNARDWVEPCLKARWEILWPHSLESALLHDHQSQRIFLIQEFADYVVKPKNWMMQRVILEAFPEIEGSEINIPTAQAKLRSGVAALDHSAI